MNPGAPPGPDRVRVTVVAAGRRVDLALPAAVPVAELVPELARLLGLGADREPWAGLELTTLVGARLDAGCGLAGQGIQEGALLTLAPAQGVSPPRVYDDVVELVGEAVERDVPGRLAESWSYAGLAAVTLAFLVGLGGMALEGGHRSGLAAAGVAAVLVVVSAGIGWGGRPRETGVVMAWLAMGYAAMAGWLLSPGDAATNLAGAGAGVVLAGGVLLVWYDAGQAAVLPPVLVGLIVAVTGVLSWATGVQAPVTLALALLAAVLVGGAAPWLVLARCPTATHVLGVLDPSGFDSALVALEIGRAQRLLMAASATVGLLLVMTGPALVTLGPAGAMLSVVCCVAVGLRAREHENGLDTAVGLVAGLVGLVAVATTAMVLHPSWQPTVVGAAAGFGGLVLTLVLLPGTLTLHRQRLTDLLEAGAQVALVPLLVVASGLLDVVTG